MAHFVAKLKMCSRFRTTSGFRRSLILHTATPHVNRSPYCLFVFLGAERSEHISANMSWFIRRFSSRRPRPACLSRWIKSKVRWSEFWTRISRILYAESATTRIVRWAWLAQPLHCIVVTRFLVDSTIYTTSCVHNSLWGKFFCNLNIIPTYKIVIVCPARVGINHAPGHAGQSYKLAAVAPS